jgi:hypothetical protein
MPRQQNVQCNHWPRTCTAMSGHINPIPFSEDTGHFGSQDLNKYFCKYNTCTCMPAHTHILLPWLELVYSTFVQMPAYKCMPKQHTVFAVILPWNLIIRFTNFINVNPCFPGNYTYILLSLLKQYLTKTNAITGRLERDTHMVKWSNTRYLWIILIMSSAC